MAGLAWGEVEHRVICADCGSPMNLRDSKHGKFYGCTRYPQCNGTHGAQKDGRPLGKPADMATKDARIRAHAVFDMLWKGSRKEKKKRWYSVTRTEAYEWMQNQMNLSADEAHIGLFSIDQCQSLIGYVKGWIAGEDEY